MSSRQKTGVWLLLLFDALMASARQALPAQGYKPAESSMTVLTNSQPRMVEPGIFEIGKVRLDQRHRSVLFSRYA